MKIIYVFMILICGCASNTNETPKSETLIKPASTLDTAKATAKKIFEYVELADKGELSKKQLDKVAKPLQNQLDSMRVLLQPNEITELDNYRTQLVGEMADRKAKRDRNK